jgi:threonine aldolase
MPEPWIDLRSDTVTLPTQVMLQSVLAAPLGDDVYREDPTVALLERRVAALLGHDQGLLMVSGTMANLCAMLTHTPRGHRVICGRESHVYCYEAGGASALGGLVLHPIANDREGGLHADELEAALPSPDDPHIAPAGLVTLENTHSRLGGVVLGPDRTRALVARARVEGVPVHLDGARLFNAATVRARRLAAGLRARCARWLEVDDPSSNVVMLRSRSADRSVDQIVRAVADEHVLISTLGSDRARAVTHLGIDDAAIDRAIEVLAQAAP